MREILLSAILMIFFSQIAFASAQQSNELHFDVTDSWYMEVDEDSIENRPYVMKRELESSVCKNWDARNFDPDVQITIDPADNLTVMGSWRMIQRDGLYIIDWEKIPDQKCTGGGIQLGIEENKTPPIRVKRKIDKIFFDEKGTQTVLLELTVLESVLEAELQLEREPNEYAEIRLLSQSREYIADWGEGAFHIRNPVLGKLYTFILELEVTPKKDQVSYVPRIWMSATSEHRDVSSVTGTAYSMNSEFGTVSLKSTEEAFIRGMMRKRFSANLRGLSTTAKIAADLAEITRPAPSDGEDAERPWDTTSIMLLVAVAAIVGVIFTLLLVLRKVGMLKRPKSDKEMLAELDKEEAEIRSAKKSTHREYLKGMMSEEDFKKITTEYESRLMAVMAKKTELSKKS
ncbi:MAG: hypothetical protein JSV63_02465 [Candidatus Aenigmatarchaeota archaeon]|nr:MAG: hypothetical protein JSV63_02465 [Candidatus Aenigmarchaeota archaeon]